MAYHHGWLTGEVASTALRPMRRAASRSPDRRAYHPSCAARYPAYAGNPLSRFSSMASATRARAASSRPSAAGTNDDSKTTHWSSQVLPRARTRGSRSATTSPSGSGSPR